MRKGKEYTPCTVSCVVRLMSDCYVREFVERTARDLSGFVWTGQFTESYSWVILEFYKGTNNHGEGWKRSEPTT